MVLHIHGKSYLSMDRICCLMCPWTVHIVTCVHRQYMLSYVIMDSAYSHMLFSDITYIILLVHGHCMKAYVSMDSICSLMYLWTVHGLLHSWKVCVVLCVHGQYMKSYVPMMNICAVLCVHGQYMKSYVSMVSV